MESQKKSLSLKNYSTISLILACTAPVFAVAMSVMMIKLFETDAYHFKNGTPWFGVLVAALIVVGAAAFVLSLTQKKGSLPDAYPFDTRISLSASVIAGIALLVFAVSDIRTVLTTEVHNANYEYITGFARLFANRFNAVTTVSAILALVGVAYFLIPVFSRSSKKGMRLIFGCVAVVFFIFRLLVLYYDISTPINSSVRMFDQMANSAAMIFLVYELRFLLGDPRPRLYLPFATLAFIMLAAYSTSQIVGSIFLEGLLVSLPAMIFELTLALYIFANLTGYLALCKHYEYIKPQIEEVSEEAVEE